MEENVRDPQKIPRKRNNYISKYETNVKPHLDAILAWRRRGLTEEQICNNLNVSRAQFAVYMREYEELRTAMRQGKIDADAQVENSLFKLATGFEYTEVKRISLEYDPSTPVETINTLKNHFKLDLGKCYKVERTTKFCSPNPSSVFFYLVNRCSNRWQSIQNIRIGNPDGTPIQSNLNIGIVNNDYAGLTDEQKLKALQDRLRLIGFDGNRLTGENLGG